MVFFTFLLGIGKKGFVHIIKSQKPRVEIPYQNLTKKLLTQQGDVFKKTLMSSKKDWQLPMEPPLT